MMEDELQFATGPSQVPVECDALKTADLCNSMLPPAGCLLTADVGNLSGTCSGFAGVWPWTLAPSTLT